MVFVEGRSCRVEEYCKSGRGNVTARNDAGVTRSRSKLTYRLMRLMIFRIFTYVDEIAGPGMSSTEGLNGASGPPWYARGRFVIGQPRGDHGRTYEIFFVSLCGGQ
jgi:hypothetical protein